MLDGLVETSVEFRFHRARGLQTHASLGMARRARRVSFPAPPACGDVRHAYKLSGRVRTPACKRSKDEATTKVATTAMLMTMVMMERVRFEPHVHE